MSISLASVMADIRNNKVAAPVAAKTRVRLVTCDADGCRQGTWTGEKYTRKCHHCRGLGYITPQQAVTNKSWTAVNGTGYKHTNYESWNTENDWRYS